jgi:hypothetical protein
MAGMRFGHAMLAGTLMAQGCLPGDERPEPASLYVTTGPSGATDGGFVTADGWSVRFERVVTAVGDIRFHSEECNKYGQTRYRRLFDFTLASGEKAGLVYGLGSCRVEFTFDTPREDSPLGVGTSEQDLVFMRSRSSDPYAHDAEVGLWVVGTATRHGVTLSFDWPFRHAFELTDCKESASGARLSDLDLVSGERHELEIEIRAEELFRVMPEDDAPLQLEAFAEADSNADGAITIAELAEGDLPLVAVQAAGSGTEPVDIPSVATLGDLVYEIQLPRVARLRGGGECEAEREDW